MMNKKLSVIIVSFNSQDFIDKCIISVLKFLPDKSEVIVLDNASEDLTVDKLKQFTPKIKLIISDKNLGFSNGNNKAVKIAKGEYLFFLNPDTYLTEDIFTPLINFYQADENIGIIGPKLITPDGSIQATVKKFPSVWGAFKELILGIPKTYSQYIPKENKPIIVDCVYGAAFLISANLFRNCGGFDERYFLYYEDIDLCRKLKKLNKKIYYYPLIELTHLVGATKSNQNRLKLNWDSAKIYHGDFEAFILQIIFFFYRIKRKLHSVLAPKNSRT